MPDPGMIQQMVETRATEAPPTADNIAQQAADYVGQHRAHKARIAKLDALVDGRWDVVWPDGSVTTDAPQIADFVTSDWEDLAALISQAEPTLITDADTDKTADVKFATKRQHIGTTYREMNNIRNLRYRLATDLVGTGIACVVVWPDFATGYPRFVRKDPRHVYPDPSLYDAQTLSSLAIGYKTKARLLKDQYPFMADALFTRREREQMRELDTAEVGIYEWYDSKWCVKVALYQPGRANEKMRSVTLAAVPNMIGQPLAMLACRVTPDGKFRGQFDKALGPLGTANKMMEMHLAQLSDMIFSEKIVRGTFDNPDDIGPGATLYTMDPNAAIDRAVPAGSHPQMYNDLQTLLQQAREAAGVPQARHGNIDQSIASASFVNAITGKYITAVEMYQRILADLEERCNSLAYAIDENYLDWEKPLTGTSGGKSVSGTYVPSVDIAGNYNNRVVYGAGSGMDAYNRRLANIQSVDYGFISRRNARAQLPEVQDVIAEEAEIAREQLENGFLSGLADPATPLDLRMRALTLAQEGNSISDIAAIMLEEQQAAAEAQAQAQAQVEEVVGPGLPPAAAAGPALPPLSGLRG